MLKTYKLVLKFIATAALHIREAYQGRIANRWLASSNLLVHNSAHPSNLHTDKAHHMLNSLAVKHCPYPS